MEGAALFAFIQPISFRQRRREKRLRLAAIIAVIEWRQTNHQSPIKILLIWWIDWFCLAEFTAAGGQSERSPQLNLLFFSLQREKEKKDWFVGGLPRSVSSLGRRFIHSHSIRSINQWNWLTAAQVEWNEFHSLCCSIPPRLINFISLLIHSPFINNFKNLIYRWRDSLLL